MPIIRKLGKKKLLLDTHVWIWLVLGDPSLKSSFRKNVRECVQDRRLLLSIISIWEIGMLAAKDRLVLDLDPFDWVEKGVQETGSRLVSITTRIAIQSSRLPGTLHGDPADRLLVATARDKNAVLVTCDQKLLKFGEDPFLSVYNPKS